MKSFKSVFLKINKILSFSNLLTVVYNFLINVFKIYFTAELFPNKLLAPESLLSINQKMLMIVYLVKFSFLSAPEDYEVFCDEFFRF
jgi:hypothetical protein